MGRSWGAGGVDRRLLGLIALSTLLGIGHHADHLVRGNHVGWPVTPEVNAFTFSLVIYPLIAVGLLLTVTDRVGIRYWLAVAAGGLAMLAAVHLGPWAIEPPADVIGPYGSPLLGYTAFAWLLGLLGALLATTVYAVSALRRGDGVGGSDRA